MARFNTPVATATKTTNLAGGSAYAESTELEIVSILLCSMVQDQFYRTANDTMNRLNELIAQVEPKFSAKAALYARNEFGMRSITHVASVALAKRVKGEEWTKRFYEKVARRPDDILEVLALLEAQKIKLPNAMRKGFGAALSRFDEYQLAKYRKDGASVSLVDAVNILHPKSTEALTALMKGTLKAAETWETKLTQAGQKSKGNDEEKMSLKADAWADLIRERKLGYFALLRNLRNIAEQAPAVLDEALAMLVDEKLLRKSLVMPFRFFTAYHELQSVAGSNKILAAVAKALELSFANVPKFSGRTLVVVDHSGSMGSGHDSPFMKGALFGIALAKSNDSDFIHFGTYAKYLSFNPSDSTLSIAGWLEGQNSGRNEVGHGTDFNSIFQIANKAYDRICIFSDMQGWIGGGAPKVAFSDYRQRYKADPHIYSFDLAGHGTLMFPERNIYCLAGFSEKVFDLMAAMEQGRDGLVKKIRAIEL